MFVPLKAIFDRFPLGKAPALLLILTIVSGLWLLFNPIPENTATLRVWTFAKQHYTTYVKVGPAFEAKHPGTELDIQLVSGDAVRHRVLAAMMADLDVPDLVEVEISVVGGYFRGPVEDVGFIDLTGWLHETGYYDRVVKTRFAPYTNRGRIFGLPHDVHPVMLAYRRDIFEAEGVDVSEIETWDDFIRVGRRITIPGKRYMMEMANSDAGHFYPLLFQRDGGFFDAEGRVIMDNEIAVEAVKWYIPLVAGPDRIGGNLGPGFIFTQALEEGYFLSLLCPDWRSRSVEMDVPRMAGKMALMPLPAVKPGGRRTTTWGGTMIGITKNCPNKELALELAEHFYFHPEMLAERFDESNILPPLRDVWDHPVFHKPRPYWSGQPIGRLYAELANQIPAWYTTPFTKKAIDKMSEVISACSTYYNQHGEDGFDLFVRQRLKRAADDMRRIMQRNPYP